MRYGSAILALCLVFSLLLGTSLILNASQSSQSGNIQITFPLSISGLTATPGTVSATDNLGKSLTSVTVFWGDNSQSEWTASSGPLANFFTSHTYQNPDTYPVTVEAIDSANNEGTLVQQVVVPPATTSSTTPTTSSSTLAPITLTFTVSTSDLTVTPTLVSAIDNSGKQLTSVMVSWGDNSQSQWTASEGDLGTFFTAHTYPSAGPYTIIVTATDSGNQQSTITQQVTVGSTTSTSSSTSPSGPLSMQIPFNVVSSGLTATPILGAIVDPNAATGAKILEVDVSWGDQTPDAIWVTNGYPMPSTFPGAHQYDSAGPYTITITVLDSANLQSFSTQSITVPSSTSQTTSSSTLPSSSSATSSPSTALSSIGTSFTVSGSGLSAQGQISISDPNTNSGAQLTLANWDWGDGTPNSIWIASQGTAALDSFPGSHIYATSGTYAVTASVKDSANAAGVATHTITTPIISPTSSPSSIITSSAVTVSGLTVTPQIVINDPNLNSGASLVEVDFSWGDGSANAIWTSGALEGSSSSYSSQSGQNILAPAASQLPPSTFPGSHTYAAAGTYSLVQIITDSVGGTATLSQPVLAGTASSTSPAYQQAIVTATVSNSYGSGTGFTLSTSGPFQYSPTSAVNSSNAQTSLWLLSCPNQPNLAPLAANYFNNNPPSGQAPFGGNMCMPHPSSSTTQVVTTATLTPSYYGSYSSSGSFTSTLGGALMGSPLTSSLTGTALFGINSLGFATQVDNYISDAFSQNVNVFSPVSSQNLHLLWSWFSEIPYISSSKSIISYSPATCDKNQNCVGDTYPQHATSGPYTTSYVQTDASGDSTDTECSYPSYSYISDVKVSNFGSTYIPYTETLGSPSKTNTFNADIFPYINYQISLPSLFGQTLSVPYYVFSPSLYNTPSNQLDSLPISIGGEFFVGFNSPKIGDQLAMSSPGQIAKLGSTPIKTTVTTPGGGVTSGSGFCAVPSLQQALTYANQPSQYDPDNPPPYPFPGIGGYQNSLYCNYCQNNPSSSLCTSQEYGQYLVDCTGQTYPAEYGDHNQVTALGNLEPTPAYCSPFTTVQSGTTNIINPLSIVSLPTDYTYILYKASASSYGLATLRTIPTGRYDVGVPAVPAAPDSLIWNAEWQQYWQQVIGLQNDNMYIVSQSNPAPSGFTPINMTVDYSGDIFLTGMMKQSSGALAPALYEIPAAGTAQSSSPIIIQTTTLSASGGSDYAMPEIAASPTGKYVYLANQSDGGYIYEYAVGTTSSGSVGYTPTAQPINLAYQAQTSTGGSSSMLNIAYWLENQGLYNQQIPFDINSYLNSYTHPAGLETDAPAYHHPISIQDVNGYIYVLDNWAGALDIASTSTQATKSVTQTTGSDTSSCVFDCSYKALFFSTLNMRVLDTSLQQTSDQNSGINLPISPTLFNDLFTTKTGTCVLSLPQGATPSSTNCYQPNTAAPTCVIQGTTDTSDCSAPVQTSCNLPSSEKIPGSQGPTATGTSYLCTTASTKATTYTSLATPTPFAIATYPPYGWIISANIMEGTLTNSFGSDLYTVSSDPSASYSVCSASTGSQACNLNPTNLASLGYTGTFAPIGPHILALDQQAVNAKLCIFVIFCTGSSDDAIKYSGDIRSAFAPHYYNTGFSIGFNQSVSLLFTTDTSQSAGGIFNEYPYTASNPNTYNALIFTGLNAQNYTKLFDGNSQVSCYVDNLALTSATGCMHLNAVMNMQSPVYNMPDPLKFVESLGGGQSLTFAGSVASSYQSTSTTQASSQCTTTPSQGVVCNGVSVPGAVSESQSGTTTPDTTSLPLLQQYATATISGEVFVPYQFTSSTTQQWSNFVGGKCTITQKFSSSGGRTPPPKITNLINQARSSPIISGPTSVSSTLYTYGSTPIITNTIVAPIEGGTVYLQNLLNNYYQQNLSDIGLTIAPQFIYTIQSNRQIADTMINITTNNLHSGNGNQYILNATHNLQYYVNTYSQGSHPGYELITSAPLSPSQIGVEAAASVLSNSGSDPASKLAFAQQNYLGQNTIYTLAPQTSQIATLFNFYVSMANTALSNFYMSNTLLQSGQSSTQYQALGYNRIIYIFRDKFNNTFFAPIDADIANPTQIALQVTPTVDSINANKTVLGISGTATYTINGNTQPLPLGSNILIYYGQNLNFANYNPLISPADAQSCAFLGTPAAATLAKLSPSLLTSACALANPLSSNPTTAAIATTLTYHTSYNAPSLAYPTGDCAPPPNQLLTTTTYNCNINDPATQSCPASAHGDPQYCVPQTTNGLGVCTSEQGLIGIAQTDANGAFTLGTLANPVVTCGIGSAVISAVYYGATSPQPRSVMQTPLTFASNPAYTCDAGKCTQTTVVNNYYYSPNSQTQTVPIGLFELSYGDLSLVTLGAAMGVALVLLLSKRNKAIYTRKRKIR